MRMIARCPFNDAEAKVLRRAGDTFDCSEERARRLVALKLAAIAKDQDAPEDAPEDPADVQEESEQAPSEPAVEEEPKKPAGKGKGKSSAKKAK